MKVDSKGWVDEAIGIYYGANSFGKFSPGQCKWLVIHGTAWPDGTAGVIAQSWARQVAAGILGPSTTFVIDKDGSFTQGISLLDTASGNSGAPDSPRESYLPSGNLNLVTVSVEVCKYNINDLDDLTPEQIATLFPLVALICDFNGIPRHVWSIEDVTQGGIIGHAQCDYKYRSHCPGPIPWQDLQDYLNGDTPMFSNAGCVDVWNSTGFGSDDTARTSGLFTYFQVQWREHKNFIGAPSSHEYPFTFPDGTKGVARNFGSNTIAWQNKVCTVVN